MNMTIGMACANDYQGVYFTVMALRMYQGLRPGDEILVVDNAPDTEQGELTKTLIEDWVHGTYIPYTEKKSTAVRGEVFAYASNEIVLCLDCHVLLEQGSVYCLRRHFEREPDCKDLVLGVFLHDDLGEPVTHMDPVWRGGMYGIWALDDAGRYPSCPPFPIPMQGLAAFACRKDAWLGFHPQFRGFGCEEWYIAEKYRRAGHQAICLPGLRWVHRFNKPKDLPVGNPPPTVEDKVWNYLLAFREFGMDPTPMIEHFGQEHPPTQKWEDLAIHYHHHLDAIGQSPSRLRQLNP